MFAMLSPGTELSRFRRGTLPRIAVVVMLFIPLIYGALYLWAFDSPDKHLDGLSVALVNEDEGTVRDGEPLNAGDELEHKLLDGADLDWHATDAADAASGVSDGTYYLSLTIPRDFSANAVSVGTEHPSSATLKVDYNDSNNFLAGVLGKQAMAQVQAAVSTQLGNQVASSLLVGLNDAGEGLRDAAAGAGELTEGIDSAVDGAGQLTAGLGSLADGTLTLQDGAFRLSAGANTLASGLTDLTAGTSALSAGSSDLAAGAQSLSDGTAQLSTGAAGVASGAQSLENNLTALSGKLNGAVPQSSELNAGASQVSSGLDSVVAGIAAQNPDSPLLAQLKPLAEGARQVAAGTQTLQTGVGQAADGAGQLAAGSADLSAGAAQVSAGAQSAADGAAALSSGAGNLATGASQVDAGAQAAARGAADLNAGAATLSGGTSDLAAGAGELLDGGTALSEGAGQLSAGSHTLADALAEGGKALPQDSADAIDAKAAVAADPVELDAGFATQADSFGEGFAPFFLALATFVGALITWLLLRALPTRALAAGISGFRAAATGLIPALAIGLGQVLIMMAVLVWGLDIHPAYLLGTGAFLYLTTVAFLALQQMLIIVLGTAAGRVVSLVLLMLQLSSSGGTYPVETTPGFFQALHPFMPATYVVNGLRALITGGVDARMWTAVAVLGILTAVCVAVSSLSAGRQRMWTIKRLHPELHL
ncbi:YhgE/Pip domain-containing protein [Arthrobacter koreensis]|uniref:YhgE/Pip domain-containing protein n=1 Tax=Arthrobacter koreensis TaxID=199136 RepID=A0ABY6FWJ6_9MICC|nr:YhgE/Pip domain-containing protein [Arthrobacter koreensis]UYB37142.1 YhgE/Pip domain-containing protein [Arthrobacter koreensis]